MKRAITIGLLILAATTTAQAQHGALPAPKAASAKAPVQMQPVGRPVARVNGAILTDRDLQREEFAIFPYARQHGGGIPKDMEPGIRSGAMQMIIFEELVYQEALRRKLTIPASELQKAEADFRSQFSKPQEYQEFLKEEFNGSEAAMREKIKRSLLIEAVLKTDVDSKGTMTSAEVRAYYDKHPTRFEYPESFAIQTISFMGPAKATPQQVNEARKRADAALAQIKATKTYEQFGMLAEKISEDDYHVMMGDHKAVERSKISPQILQALQAIQPGQITGILQVDQIFTVVRLNKHNPSGKLKYEDVKVVLKNELEKKKVNEVRAALDKKLRQTAKIEVL